MVSATVRGILAQRLVRKICPHCKCAWQGEDSVRLTCGGGEYWMGAGCNRCRGTGYAGRLGVFELLIPSAELLEVISCGASLQELHRLFKQMNLITLQADGLEKVRQGLTTPEEVLCMTRSAA